MFFEPTDRRKATKPFVFNKNRRLQFSSPNLNELIAILDHINGPKKAVNFNNDVESILKNIRPILEYIDNLFITLGSKGILLIRKGERTDAFFEIKNNKISYKRCNGNKLSARIYSPKVVENIVSVSGAGDCFASGFIMSMLKGYDENFCVNYGLSVARCALKSQSTIPFEISNLSNEISINDCEDISCLLK